VDGIRCQYIETHNFGKSAKFWLELGWALEEDLGNAGVLRAPAGGAYIFLEEVPEGRELACEPYFNVVDGGSFAPKVEVVKPFEDTHWGTKVMQVRDPDGRVFNLEDAGQRAPNFS
jgi:hypothetical protein